MAKWSVLKYGSSIDSAENDVPCRIDGFFDAENLPLEEHRLDDSRIEYIDGLRSLFYKVLVAFLKDVASRACVHPVLAKTGDGKLVDLFELYFTVRRRGGYGAVSESCEWGSVTEELGFDDSYVSSLKLMHFKYLHEFDIWLRNRCRDLLVEDEKWECELDDFGSLSLELEMGLKALAIDGLARTKFQYCVLHSDNKTKVNHQVRIGHGDADSLTISSMQSPAMKYQKRKRESLKRMLSWIIDVAKHPDDVGIVLEHSKLRKQVLLARVSLFQRRTRQSNSGIQETPQKKLKVHLSNYSDHKASSTCSKSLHTITKSSLFMLCDSLPVSQRQSIGPKIQLENCLKVQATKRLKESKDRFAYTNTNVFPYDEPRPNYKPIGPLFQAKVPKWTGIICESDPKWLGTKVWPLQDDGESLGRGRENICSCVLPSSVECVKFHIAEKRMKLKLQLGYSLFYDWRFNCMGEEVAIWWTPEEETRFKKILRSSQGECLWDGLFRYFPKKTREDLVSYYFNVFLLQRRRYQNRVTPKEIDSDDDDLDFGSFGDCLGSEGARMLNYLPCSLNEQCTDWE